ncbi:MAG: hypothetical protein CVU39_05800 [Chloroflexi bacterium HGW-Chloroflexi-10]|nr:MAG: hypothetical protein CVU39_05800 [Chloroflexi bacterium HGW-Chloroflexi-10]
MTKETMIRTKISIPRLRSDTLHRERLLETLKSFLDYKLVLVTAPAGYGKTTLLVDFATNSGMKTAWYSLDRYDQDLRRFISHLIGAIGVQYPQFGQDAMAALLQMQPDRLNPEEMVTALVNDIYDHILDHFVLVLDDFHLVEDSVPIVSFLSRLIDLVDENCHLVILSRTLVGLPNLPLMVARNLVNGLDFDALSFNTEEIRTLFKQNYQMELSTQQVNQLSRESEGWITGLLLSTAQTKLGGGVQHAVRNMGIGIDEYLGSQIIAKESPQIQQFLLQSSLLEEFNADLCEKILGKFQSEPLQWKMLMQEVLQKNLFLVAVQDAGSGVTYLRFHHLFRDFLQKKAFLEIPEKAQLIRESLARFFAEQREWERAIEILFSLGKKEDVAILMQDAGRDLIVSGKENVIQQWLKALTGSIRMEYPVLLSLQGVVSIMQKDVSYGIVALSDAIQLLRERPEQNSVLYQSLARRATAYRMTGELQLCEQDLDELSEYLKINPVDFHLACRVFVDKANILFQRRQFEAAMDAIRKADQIYFAMDDEEAKAGIAADKGMIQRALGFFEEAEKTYLDAITFFEKRVNFRALANMNNNLGFLYYLEGKYSTAAICFQKTIHFARSTGYMRMEAYGLASLGDLYYDIDAMAEALESFQSAATISEEIQDKGLNFYLNCSLLRVYKKQNSTLLFEETLQKLEKYSSENLYRQTSLYLVKAELALYGNDFSGISEYINFFFRNVSADMDQIDLARAGFINFLALVHQGKEIELEKSLDELMEYMQNSSSRINYLSSAKRLWVWLESAQNFIKRKEVKQKYQTILELLSKFGENTNETRKRIRQYVLDAPVPTIRYRIQSFGVIKVVINNLVVSGQEWQANVAREMLFLIMQNRIGLTKEQISEILWQTETDDADELALRFKNTIYRLRRVMGKDAILLSNNRYYFNTNLDYEYDAEEFEKNLVSSEQVLNDQEKINRLYQAIKIYSGEYMPQENNYWVISERERYQMLFRTAVIKLSELLFLRKQYQQVIVLVKPLLEQEPEFEETHRILMRAFAGLGDPRRVIQQFENLSGVLKTNLGIKPSAETIDLYHSIIKKTK